MQTCAKHAMICTAMLFRCQSNAHNSSSRPELSGMELAKPLDVLRTAAKLLRLLEDVEALKRLNHSHRILIVGVRQLY